MLVFIGGVVVIMGFLVVYKNILKIPRILYDLYFDYAAIYIFSIVCFFIGLPFLTVICFAFGTITSTLWRVIRRWRNRHLLDVDRYRLYYEGSEGNYSIEFFTGIEIVAGNKTDALDIAKKFEENVIADWIAVYFINESNPYLDFKISSLELPTVPNVHMTSPAITQYKLLKPQGEHEMLMGFPIFTENDLVSISEQEFLEGMARDYSTYFTNKNKTSISYENISYSLLKKS